MTMIKLDDPDLFGNDAAEDESPERLAFYFVDKDVFKTFRNEDVRLSIAMARKGIGKSAILAHTAFLLERAPSKPLVVNLKGSDLVAQRPMPSMRSDILIYDWQQRICTAVVHRLAQALSVAIDDDSSLMVEASEIA